MLVGASRLVPIRHNMSPNGFESLFFYLNLYFSIDPYEKFLNLIHSFYHDAELRFRNWLHEVIKYA